jgi:hypothetical protein
MSLKPGHWNSNYPSGKWEHDIPLEFADVKEIIAWCQREFIDYATCMRYEVYNNRAKFIFYDNQDYVSFLLRWA